MDNPFLKNLSAVVLDEQRLFADSFARVIELSTLFRNVNVYYHEKDLMQHLTRFRTTDTLYLFTEYYLGERTLPLFLNDVRRLSGNVKVIVVSSITNPFLLHNLLRYEPEGIISKGSPAHTLIDCVYEVANGKPYISEDTRKVLAADSAATDVQFTPREIELLQHFANGLAIRKTAEVLQLSVHTIAAHRRKMMSKTQTTTITGLLAVARKLNVIE